MTRALNLDTSEPRRIEDAIEDHRSVATTTQTPPGDLRRPESSSRQHVRTHHRRASAGRPRSARFRTESPRFLELARCALSALMWVIVSSVFWIWG